MTSAGRSLTRTPPLPGWAAFEHRRFLSEFFAGRFPGSFARGALFQENPLTGDARISGMAASLCGIEGARGGRRRGRADAGSEAARVHVRGGLLLRRHPAHLHGRRAGHAERSAGGRKTRRTRTTTGGCTGRGWTGPGPPGGGDPSSVEGRAFTALQGLARARQQLLALRSGGTTEILPTGNRSVLAYRRVHPRSAPFLSLTNFSDFSQPVDAEIVARAGLTRPGSRTAVPRWTRRAPDRSSNPGATPGSPEPDPGRPRMFRPVSGRLISPQKPHHTGYGVCRNGQPGHGQPGDSRTPQPGNGEARRDEHSGESRRRRVGLSR